MSREWKPGDVAEVGCGVAMRHDDGRWVFPDGSHNVDREGIPTRPLVVIDPEDREQVERLAEALGDKRADTRGPDGVADALRSLIAPPKPEEPTGLGAVVEDARGDLYVRSPQRDGVVWRGTGTWVYKDWGSIDAVNVLSQGVES